MMEVQNSAGILVNFQGTSVELSNKIGITREDDQKSELGAALVTSIGSYYGIAKATMWEWMKNKAERFMNNRSPISSAPLQSKALFFKIQPPISRFLRLPPRVPNYADERDSLHVATNLATMREKLGELTASITSLSTNAADLRQ